ncbi:Two component system response regulator/histidine kinase [Desulfonema limicola]|uniref:histidine kinase n=1 Tax=Desulfonema limicola TaxID=45656 RepID=A0A975GHW2_9BACT|nr:hybrid sensor histidine kinase/response regulator [Desulfonema limicola]QTA81779.1 Two component system response regulator/histidine kinase [Desulfonema limicola]
MNNIEKDARILIVDDTPQNTQILGTILLKEGYKINVARNGRHALDVIEKILPDIILLDVMMPELDGFETCKILKASQKTKEIPVIFLTARTDTEDLVQGFDLGAVDYVTKPFNSTELLMRVRTHLELKLSREMIETVSNERKELLHVLCHDLANPFNAMISVLNIAEDYSKFDSYKKDLLSAAKSGTEIIKLVRDMRSLEEKKLNLINTSLLYSIAQSYFLLGSLFSKKNIELEVNIDEDIEIIAEHSSFINSVLNNIFTNAIKFSYPDSKIVVNAEKKGRYAYISIRDFGIGISENMLANLFNISKNNSRTGTSGEIGTGFGMPIIKKFINAYGGEIEVFSQDEALNTGSHGTEVKLKLQLGENI